MAVIPILLQSRRHTIHQETITPRLLLLPFLLQLLLPQAIRIIPLKVSLWTNISLYHLAGLSLLLLVDHLVLLSPPVLLGLLLVVPEEDRLVDHPVHLILLDLLHLPHRLSRGLHPLLFKLFFLEITIPYVSSLICSRILPTTSWGLVLKTVAISGIDLEPELLFMQSCYLVSHVRWSLRRIVVSFLFLTSPQHMY
jgi:hypothetical protein